MSRIAFVGCGGIQQVHYQRLAQIDDIEFVGQCDVDPSCAERAAQEHGGAPFDSPEAMYDAVKPDAVFIAVPPYAHGPAEMAAIERGIPMFIEKPVALDKRTARSIARAVSKARLLCSVAYCFRYHDTVRAARQFLKGRPICLVSAEWRGGLPQTWWWRRMECSGGQIVEQTTHLVDLIRYLCGDVAEVYAVGSSGCMTAVPDYSVHDSSVASLRLKNGAVASVSSTCVSEHESRVVLHILTPEASVTFSDGRVTIREDGQIIERLPKADIYLAEDRAFIDALRSGRRNGIRSTYADALKTFLVTAAANESMQSGLPVRV